MALLPSIMSLFGSRAETPQADPVIQQQQQTTAAANPSVPSGATPKSDGSVVAIPAAGTGDKSPLDNFADLWKADPNQNQQTPSLVPSFNLDHAGLMKAAESVNFTNHIDPAMIDKALAGDREAFLSVINKASQYGFVTATAASGELVKNSLGTAQQVLKDKVLPAAHRSQQVDEALAASNPVFQDPAVAPMLGMLKQQLQAKYPTTSPAEIATLASQYLEGMAGKIVGANGGTITSKQDQQRSSGFGKGPETNWETFFAS